jgi:hypothetical protein
VATEHDGEFGAVDAVLTFCGIRIENDAKRAFGIFFKGDGLRN